VEERRTFGAVETNGGSVAGARRVSRGRYAKRTLLRHRCIIAFGALPPIVLGAAYDRFEPKVLYAATRTNVRFLNSVADSSSLRQRKIVNFFRGHLIDSKWWPLIEIVVITRQNNLPIRY